MVTSDSGHTWHDRYPVGLDEQYLTPHLVHPVDSKNCWLLSTYVDKDVRCFQSSDSGRSWTERGRFFPERYNIVGEDLLFANANQGWVLFFESRGGSRFHSSLCRTEDGGKHWSRSTLTASGRPQKMTFADTCRGWIAEMQFNSPMTQCRTVIHSTSDGGITWDRTSLLDGGVRDLCVAPSGELFVCGRRGMLASSPDSGKTWTILRSHTRMTLESIHFQGSVGITAGTGDLIRSKRSVVFLLTKDGGRSWNRIESPIRSSIIGMHLTAWDRGVMATAEALYQFRLR
jgi:photosystem II stability/assembly factor-like uncharacterized protein